MFAHGNFGCAGWGWCEGGLPQCGFVDNYDQHINGLVEGKNGRKTLCLMVKTMVSCRFSFQPISWTYDFGVFAGIAKMMLWFVLPYLQDKMRCSRGQKIVPEVGRQLFVIKSETEPFGSFNDPKKWHDVQNKDGRTQSQKSNFAGRNAGVSIGETHQLTWERIALSNQTW